MSDYVKPDWGHAVLLTIDVQQDFALSGAPSEIPGTMAVVPQMQQLVETFRQAHKPIIHVVRLYLPDGSNVDLCRRQAVEQRKSIVLVGSPGAELLEVLKPTAAIALDPSCLLAGNLQVIGPQEWILYKPRWGAFYQTMLDQHLRELAITTLLICGCNFPNCPRATIYEASERDFRVVFIADATSGTYERGLQELHNIGVSVITTEECLRAIGPSKREACQIVPPS